MKEHKNMEKKLNENKLGALKILNDQLFFLKSQLGDICVVKNDLKKEEQKLLFQIQEKQEITKRAFKELAEEAGCPVDNNEQYQIDWQAKTIKEVKVTERE